MTSLAELTRRLKPGRTPDALPPLILMTDTVRLREPEAAAARLPRGSAVILRHYNDPDRVQLAVRLAAICRARGLTLLVAGDARLALRVGAGGLHLPEGMLRAGPACWRVLRKRNWIVTAAAHGPAAIRRAHAAGVDAVLLAPVFATESHPEARALGPLKFAAWVRQSPLPVYALGGITAESLARLAGSGAAGIAAIGAFQLSESRESGSGATE